LLQYSEFCYFQYKAYYKLDRKKLNFILSDMQKHLFIHNKSFVLNHIIEISTLLYFFRSGLKK